VLDEIEIDLGGLFEKRQLIHTSELFQTIFQHSSLEYLSLALMDTNLSDLSELATGFSKIDRLIFFSLDASKTYVSDVSLLAMAIGFQDQLQNIQLNFS
jgi:hypothetical protein